MKAMKVRNVLLYYLLSSVKELGISLPLVFRRITEKVKKDIDYISKEFFGSKLKTETLESIARDLADMLVREEIAEKIDLNFDEGIISIAVHNCCYLSLAQTAKQHGEQGCPICLVALAASIAQSFTKGIAFNEANYESDIENKKCIIKVTYSKE